MWDFGDGTTSTDQSPNHRYTIAGTYNVELTVSGPGGTDTTVMSDLIAIEPGPPVHIEISPTMATLAVQEGTQFTAVARDEFGNVVPSTFAWAMDGEGGSITVDGLFTADTVAGIFAHAIVALLQRESGELVGSASVAVEPGPLSRVVVEPAKVTLEIGGTQSFSLKAFDAFDNETTDIIVTWTVPPDVGAIDTDGMLTAGTKAGPFPAAVRLEAVEGTTRLSATADVVVQTDPLVSIQVEPSPALVSAGDSIQLTAKGLDAHGNEIPGVAFLWDTQQTGFIDQQGSFTPSSIRAQVIEVRVSAVHMGSEQVATATVKVLGYPVAGGPGAVYLGRLDELAGPAPIPDLGGVDGGVPLESLESHRYIYESPYYRSLIKKANFTNPTELITSGEGFNIRLACVSRNTLDCKLIESYWAPNLLERSKGQLELVATFAAEQGLNPFDMLSVIADGTLEMATIYSGLVQELPELEIQTLWGLYPSQETNFEAVATTLPDLDSIILEATDGVVVNHQWRMDTKLYLFGNMPLRTLHDIFTLRTIEASNPALSDWLLGMGPDRTYVPFLQLYGALEQGVLDAAISTADAAYGQKWYEVSRYMNGPLHGIFASSNVISREQWDALPEDLRQILLEEGAKYELEALRLASIQNDVGVLKNLREGLELVNFSDEINDFSFNEAAMRYVIPGWIGRLGGGANNEIIRVFNEKVGPLVGLWITEAGTVALGKPALSTPTPTPPPVYGQEFLDQELSRIRSFVPFYVTMGDLTQLCVDLTQVLDKVNVPEIGMPLDGYINDFAETYWSEASQGYSVRTFQGLARPGQIVGADESQSCQR